MRGRLLAAVPRLLRPPHVHMPRMEEGERRRPIARELLRVAPVSGKGRAEISAALRELSALLELRGGTSSTFGRTRAGARALEASREPIEVLVVEKRLTACRAGIGVALSALRRTGTSDLPADGPLAWPDATLERAIEIDGNTHRLDLEPRWSREARARGLPFVLSVDRRATRELESVAARPRSHGAPAFAAARS